MLFIKYILLGIIEAIIEILPISSSGHLIIFRELFNTNMFNDLNFQTFANLGSCISILIIFWSDIKNLLIGCFKHLFGKDKMTYKKHFNYLIKIIIGSIPISIFSLIFKKKIITFSEVKVVAIALLITAITLYLTKNTTGTKKDHEITKFNAFIIGLFQMISIIPGLSHSGMVLTGSIFNNLDNKTSLKFTFMLYLPISLITLILNLINITKKGIETTLLAPYLCGLFTALIVTYYTFHWLSKLIQEGKLWKFAIYCLLFSFLILAYFR
jgi:undecaprenyl-diphosphatase